MIEKHIITAAAVFVLALAGVIALTVVDALLAASRRGDDWTARYGGWILALLLLALLLSAIHLVTLVTSGERFHAEDAEERSNPSASPRAPRETVPS